jgi:predicted DNA-binding transcriptional regulator AlpA
VIRASEPLDHDLDQATAQIGDTLPDLARLAVDAAGVARLLSVSERHTWAMHASGRLPLPCRVGRRLLWPVDELRAWCLAGMPPRERWQAMRESVRDAMASGATSAPHRSHSRRGAEPVSGPPRGKGVEDAGRAHGAPEA